MPNGYCPFAENVTRQQSCDDTCELYVSGGCVFKALNANLTIIGANVMDYVSLRTPAVPSIRKATNVPIKTAPVKKAGKGKKK